MKSAIFLVLTVATLSFPLDIEASETHETSKAATAKRENPIELNDIYSKDSKNVYIETPDYKGILNGADPATFILLNPTGESAYTKDKATVFFFETPVKDADVKTFIALNDRYGKDVKNVFLMEKVLPGADLLSFKTPFKNVWYALDKVHVFDYGRIISQADPKTFRVVSGGDKSCGPNCRYRAEDKNYLYDYNDRVVQAK